MIEFETVLDKNMTEIRSSEIEASHKKTGLFESLRSAFREMFVATNSPKKEGQNSTTTREMENLKVLYPDVVREQTDHKGRKALLLLPGGSQEERFAKQNIIYTKYGVVEVDLNFRSDLTHPLSLPFGRPPEKRYGRYYVMNLLYHLLSTDSSLLTKLLNVAEKLSLKSATSLSEFSVDQLPGARLMVRIINPNNKVLMDSLRSLMVTNQRTIDENAEALKTRKV